MLQNYGKQQIKNILFLLWKCLHVERKEREREAEGEREREGEVGRRETYHHVSPNTDNKEERKRREEEGGCKNDSVWI